MADDTACGGFERFVARARAWGESSSETSQRLRTNRELLDLVSRRLKALRVGEEDAAPSEPAPATVSEPAPATVSEPATAPLCADPFAAWTCAAPEPDAPALTLPSPVLFTAEPEPVALAAAPATDSVAALPEPAADPVEAWARVVPEPAPCEPPATWALAAPEPEPAAPEPEPSAPEPRDAVEDWARLVPEPQRLEAVAAWPSAAPEPEALALAAAAPTPASAPARPAWPRLAGWTGVLTASFMVAHSAAIGWDVRRKGAADAAVPAEAPAPRAAEAIVLVQEWRLSGDESTVLERLGGARAHAGGAPAWSAEETGTDVQLVLYRDASWSQVYAFEADLRARQVHPAPETAERLTLMRVRDEAASRLRGAAR